MKNQILIITLGLVLIFSGNYFAQTNIAEAEAKTAVSTIFDLSVKEDFMKASSLFLFNEKKELRPLNSNSSDELRAVKRSCKKIKAYIDLSDSYEINKFSSTKLYGMPAAILEVSFKSGDQKLKMEFTFVKVSNHILLDSFK